MTSYRLGSGGAINRGQSLSFTFDGPTYKGFEGDTLASALLANDQMLMARSFKYHRPRGVVTAGSAEPNALMTIGSGARAEPNARATVVELYNGLAATSQNRWPSLKRDFGAVNDLFSPFLGAGFYYKTFMWPGVFWEKLYEPLIRRAAGLGKIAMQADPDRYEKSWAHCDLLVIGAGPAGLMAALAAGRAGVRVILADEGFRLGGSLLSESAAVGGRPAAEFAAEVVEELASLPNVTLMPRTTVFGWYDDMVFGAVERVQKHVASPSPDLPMERLWRIVAKQAILAAGAEERPIVFGGNDKPGVMTAGAARTYLNRYGVAVGGKVAIFTNGGSGYRTAADLVAQGVDVTAIIDARPQSADPDAGKHSGHPQRFGHRHEGPAPHRGADRRALRLRGGDRLRCAGDVRRLVTDRAPDVPTRRQTGLVGRETGIPGAGCGQCLRDGRCRRRPRVA